MGNIMLRGDNVWSVWLKKWIPAVGVPILATGIIYTADFLKINPLPLDPAYATFITGILVTVMYQLGNLIKHV